MGNKRHLQENMHNFLEEVRIRLQELLTKTTQFWETVLGNQFYTVSGMSVEHDMRVVGSKNYAIF